MFEARLQSFEDRTERAASGPRVAALRTELARHDLTGWIVPRADRHQNEYVPAREERLAWLTGFTGSAGAAIVLMERAVLFVDGRYTLQARASFSAPSTVCSHGSKPSTSFLLSVRSIHWSGGVSTRCTISNSEVSACSRACRV